MSETVVLGAGPAGLMAAYRAATSGHRCTVLEAADSVGGMAGSFELAGQRVDYGSHRLHPATDPALLAMIGELLGPDLQLRPRSGRIRLGDRWVGFPLRTTDLLASLPPVMTARMARDSLAGLAPNSTARSARNSRPGAGQTGMAGTAGSVSFADEVAARLGRTVAEEFYGPYATKLYGRPPDQLSGELAERRVSAGSPLDIVRRLARASRPDGRTFYYPRGGYGQISERLAEAAVDAGAAIELNTAVSGITEEPDGVTVGTQRSSWQADVALSTIPVTTLAGLITPTPPQPVTAAIDQLATRAMMLVYLVIDRPRYTTFDAHYLPGPETTVARLSEPKNYRNGDDPADTTVLCAEIACWPSDDLWAWDDNELGCLVADDLERVGLPAADHVACEIRRLGSVYPVLDIATEGARATVDRWVADGPTDRVLSFGRQGLRAIDNLHHVLDMGRSAADVVTDAGTVDLARWRQRLDHFADNVVED